MRTMMAMITLLAIFENGAIAQKADSTPSERCTLKVTGMVCGACAKTVEKAAKKVEGVKSVKASQPQGTAEIAYDPAKTSPEAIASAISAKTPFKAEVIKSKVKQS